MMESGKQASLSLKLLSQAFIGKQCLLQRNSGIKSLIDSLKHGTHSTLSKLPDDTVTILEDCVWDEHKNGVFFD
jgi:hypothetical protein